MRDRGRARHKQDGGGPGEEPREGDLRGSGAAAGGEFYHRPVWLGEFAYGQREEGDEGDAFLLARLEQGFLRAVGEVVEVLHRRRDLPRLLQRLAGGAGEPQVAYLALLLELR